MSEVKQLTDGDYVLVDGAAWVEVNGFAIRVHATDEGVVVNIYKSGAEMDDPLASTYAFTSEFEEGESK